MEKQLLTPMVAETTTEMTVERQMGTVQRPNAVSFRGTKMGMTTNKTEAQETTDQTTSRTALASLVVPATNLDAQPEIVHLTREERTVSNTLTDKRIFSNVIKV